MEDNWKLKTTFYLIMLYFETSTLRNVYGALIENLFTGPNIQYHVYLIINTHYKSSICPAIFRGSWASLHLSFPSLSKADSSFIGVCFIILWSWFPPFSISPRLRIQTSHVNQPSSASIVFALWFDSSFC